MNASTAASIEPRTTPAETDYVEFWRAGAGVIGIFACAACGRNVRSVRQLPECPTCGSAVWELPLTAALDPFEEHRDVWFEDEVESVRRLGRGILFGLVTAPLCWLLPALGLYVLLR
jgi:hypothetical protein